MNSLLATTAALVVLISHSDIDINVKPLECGIERVVPPYTLIANINLGNGLESFMFSTKGGKKPDFEMLVPEGDENRHPLFYRVDRDFDGFIDIVYVDDRRDGTCDGVRVYWTPKKDIPSNRHQGTPIKPHSLEKES